MRAQVPCVKVRSRVLGSFIGYEPGTEVMFDPNTHIHLLLLIEGKEESKEAPALVLLTFRLKVRSEVRSDDSSSRTPFDLESEAAQTHKEAAGLLSLPLDPHMNRL